MNKPTEEISSHLTRKKMFLMSNDETPETVEQPTIPTMVVDEVPEQHISTTLRARLQVKEEQEESIEETAPLREEISEVTPWGHVSEEFQAPPVARKVSALEKAAQEFSEEQDAPCTDASTTVESLEETDALPGDNGKTFQAAMTTVRNYSAMSAASGLIPVPFLDMAGFMAVQLMMLRKLSKLYTIPFNTQRSKSAIVILASGINCRYMAASSSKLIPFIGAFSLAAMPVMNGALCYAVGRVFMKHFASGGTFLDFDPAKLKGYFEEQYHGWKGAGRPSAA